MQFFAYLHDPAVKNAVGRQTSHPEFEAVYAATLAKLLLCRDAERIVCKNNYNITRIAYLAKLYEDARFVIAVRHPVAHIASMARQHQRNLAHFASPIHRQYLRNAGHFEFGHERIPITIDAEENRGTSKRCGAKGAIPKGGLNTGMRSTLGPTRRCYSTRRLRRAVWWCRLSTCARQPSKKLRTLWRFATWTLTRHGRRAGPSKLRISPNTKRHSARPSATPSCRYAARRRKIMDYSYSHPKQT